VNKNLDALRALAVLLVVLGHGAAFFDALGPYGPFHLVALGALGVLLFFVHTSLVLMQSLEREPGAASFLVRRAFRIYPLAIVVILLIAVFRIPQASISAHHFAGFSPDFGDMVSNLSLTTNFSLRAPILGPTWSLSYELQMYVFLPFVFLFARTLWRASVVFLASLALAMVGRHYSATTNLSFFAPCFMSGVLAYQVGKRILPVLPAFCWLLFMGGVSALYIAGGDSPYKDYGLCLALGLAIPCFWQIRSLALTRASHYVAKYSYGIYLTHFAALYFAFDRLAAQPLALRIAMFVGLATALPMAFYHAIEEPCVRLGKRITQKRSVAQPLQSADAPQVFAECFPETTAS
jgi:peptidoglycan/LPS O-acetylase OafA/YrhL